MWTQKDVTYERTSCVDFGLLSVAEYTVNYPLFSGKQSPVLNRVCCHRRPAVVVIPVDVERQTVVMVRQFRMGALQDTQSPWLDELVAGIIDPHDTPEEAARRELFEETGLRPLHIDFLQTYWVSPGASDEQVFLYVAKVDSREVLELAGSQAEQEDIKVMAYTLPQLKQKWKKRQITNSISLIGLQWLFLNQELLTS